MVAFSTPSKKQRVLPQSIGLETPPRVSPKSQCDMKESDPKTPKSELRESDSYSTMASQGSPAPSLASTLVLGQTPPPTPGSPATPPTRRYGPDVSPGHVGSSTDRTTNKVPKKEPKNPKAEAAKGTEWMKKQDVETIPMMSADTESEEEAPQNVRLIMRVNRLRMEYRELKSYNAGYGCATEPWTSFKRGMLVDGGWQKQGRSWVKPGALPAVKLPTKVQKKLKEPGMVMPYSDWKMMAARKPMKSMKRKVGDSKSKPSRPSMRKPASAAKGSAPSTGKRTLQSFFSKKGNGNGTASSSGRKK